MALLNMVAGFNANVDKLAAETTKYLPVLELVINRQKRKELDFTLTSYIFLSDAITALDELNIDPHEVVHTFMNQNDVIHQTQTAALMAHTAFA